MVDKCNISGQENQSPSKSWATGSNVGDKSMQNNGKAPKCSTGSNSSNSGGGCGSSGHCGSK